MRFSESDEQNMRLALSEAHIALDENEIPVGCVLVRDGQVIARAHNRCEQLSDATAHAEMLAIKSVNKHLLRESTLYVTLEPCPMCAGAIAMSGVSRVIYAAADRQYGCCGSVYRITEDPVFPTFCPADGGLLCEESEALLKKGFERMRKRSRD